MHQRAFLPALLPLTLLLAGCPVWMDEDGRSGGLGPAECARTSDCDAGESCVDGTCVPTPECRRDSDCAEGKECDAGACVPSPECRVDEECAEGFRCEGEVCVAVPECETDSECPVAKICGPEGSCIPAPPCAEDADCRDGAWCGSDGVCFEPSADACRTNADCDLPTLCVEDRCRHPEDVCQFNYECGAAMDGSARACVDNGCGPTCFVDADCRSSGTHCVSGHCIADRTECVTATDCEEGSLCELGRCLPSCGVDSPCILAEDACGADDLCRPAWEPTPLCTTNEDCEPGSECVDGVCRAPCPEPPRTCLNVDVQLTHCNEETGYCEAEVERTPQCFSARDCEPDEHCVNATCRRL